MFAGPPLDYRRWIKIGLPPRLPESVPGCPGPWATPFCPSHAKTGGSPWDFLFIFCRDYFFQFLHTNGLCGSKCGRLIFRYHYVCRKKNWGSFCTGSPGPQTNPGTRLKPGRSIGFPVERSCPPLQSTKMLRGCRRLMWSSQASPDAWCARGLWP